MILKYIEVWFCIALKYDFAMEKRLVWRIFCRVGYILSYS